MREPTTKQMIDWLAANQGKMTAKRSRDIVGLLGRLEADNERLRDIIGKLTKAYRKQRSARCLRRLDHYCHELGASEEERMPIAIRATTRQNEAAELYKDATNYGGN